MSERKIKKRKILLEAASEVFRELGPNKTTLDDIAQKAGMAKTSLYYYFRDKKDIFHSVIMNEQERLFEMLLSAVEGPVSTEAKISSLLEVYYHFMSQKVQRVSWDIILEYLSCDVVFEPACSYYHQPLKDIIEHILRAGIKNGEFKPIDDIDLASQVITISMMSCNYLFIFHYRHERIRKVMRQMMGYLLSGLKMNL
jgi:AcrR family transcriptional regulator